MSNGIFCLPTSDAMKRLYLRSRKAFCLFKKAVFIFWRISSLFLPCIDFLIRQICSLMAATVGGNKSQWTGSHPVVRSVLVLWSSSGKVWAAKDLRVSISRRTPMCSYSADHLKRPACPVRCLRMLTRVVRYLFSTRYSGLHPLRVCLLGFGSGFM